MRGVTDEFRAYILISGAFTNPGFKLDSQGCLLALYNAIITFFTNKYGSFCGSLMIPPLHAWRIGRTWNHLSIQSFTWAYPFNVGKE
ncbi:hypothetical protein GCM10023310_01280 [Paenibacillus vulneris]